MKACSIEDNHWIADFKTRLSCGGDLTEVELRSGHIAMEVDALLLECPDIFDTAYASSGCLVANSKSLQSLYNDIDCNRLLSLNDYYWALSELGRLQQLCLTGKYRILAAGEHSWNDGAATAGDIPVTGMTASDIAVVNLSAASAAETLVTANPASGKIDITLSANGADGVTKLQYTVFRLIA